jgi:hypothetical protein
MEGTALMLRRIFCWFVGHTYVDVGELVEETTTAPWPAVYELRQPQECVCGAERTTYAGFIMENAK